MNLKIISQTEEPLLSRTNIKASISFEAQTPSTEDVKKQLASAAKKDEKLVVIKKIATHYGSREADVDAYIYTSEEEMKKIEPKPKEKKEKAPKPEKPAVAPKEAPKEEAPKEAPAEEKKEEAPAASEKPAEKAGKEEKASTQMKSDSS